MDAAEVFSDMPGSPIQRPDFTLELSDDGAILLVWRRELILSGAVAETAMAEVNRLCGVDRHPMLVDMSTTAEVERKARAVFARPCQANRIALLGRSPVDRVLANFILGVSTVPCPTRFFTSKSDAMSWLWKVSD